MKFPKSCPKCKGQFKLSDIENNLPAYVCKSCDGIFLGIPELNTWLSSHEKTIASTTTSSELILDEDNHKPLRCPFSGTFMIKYRFSANSERYLEYSSIHKIIWLDKGEWQLLKSLGLIPDIPKFFSKSWQKDIVQEGMHKIVEEKYKERFADDYEEILTFKNQFKKHKLFKEIQAYLDI